MNKALTVKQSIDINASKEKVWDCLTNPEKIKVYLFGTNTLTNWEEGCEIIFQGEYQGQKYRDKGKILVNKKEEMLSYTYWSSFSGLEDKPENYSVVTFQLEYKNDKTVLTLMQKGFASEQAQQHSQTSWKNILLQIKELAEKV